MSTTTTTTTKVTAKSTKVRTVPAIPVTAEGFSTKVRDTLTKSVAQGVGQVRVRVTDPTNRVEVRKVQKRIQAIGYSAGFNANFRVTLAGDVLTGQVVDLTVTDQRPGHTDPTAKTPPTRSTFAGWTPEQISAWKRANPVKGTKGSKSTKVTKGSKVTAKRVTVKRVTKGSTTVPQSLAGVASATPVDTTTVTTTKRS